MDQPWQKRFKNRIHVKPPNEENLARFVKLMWSKMKVDFLKECEVYYYYDFINSFTTLGSNRFGYN